MLTQNVYDRCMNVVLRQSAYLAAAALVGIAALASACGGSPSPNSVDHLGKSGPTTTAPPAASGSSGNAQQQDQEILAYAGCMRTHGMPNFPEPKFSNSPNGGHSVAMEAPNQHDPRFRSAHNECKHLLPNGGSPPSQEQLQAAMAQALKFSLCMRKHGVPNFPDPTESGNGISINAPDINKNSPSVRGAVEVCRRFLPTS